MKPKLSPLPEFNASYPNVSRRFSNATNGSAAKLLILVLASICLAIGLFTAALNLRPDARTGTNAATTVRVYCASGCVKPVQQVIARYNKQFGTDVRLTRTGGSGELAGQIKAEFKTGVERGADLFISADDQLLSQAQIEGIAAKQFPLAIQNPVIAVTAHRDVRISDITELATHAKIKFGIASERAAIGKIVREIARREGVLTELESSKTVDSENVMTLAQALATGSLDAAVIWDTTVNQVNQANRSPVLKIIAAADNSGKTTSSIAIGVMTNSRSQAESLQFVEFLSSPETGRPTFDQFGFSFIGNKSPDKPD